MARGERRRQGTAGRNSRPKQNILHPETIVLLPSELNAAPKPYPAVPCRSCRLLQRAHVVNKRQDSLLRELAGNLGLIRGNWLCVLAAPISPERHVAGAVGGKDVRAVYDFIDALEGKLSAIELGDHREIGRRGLEQGGLSAHRPGRLARVIPRNGF